MAHNKLLSIAEELGLRFRVQLESIFSKMCAMRACRRGGNGAEEMVGRRGKV
jgi:hypothetical protein